MTGTRRDGRRLLALALVAGTAATGHGGQAHAQDAGYLIPQSRAQATPSSTLNVNRNLVLRHTAIVSGSNFNAGFVPPGLQPLHAPINLLCPRNSPGRCTIEVSQNVQLFGTASSNRWGICTQIDGIFMAEPGCPILGVIPTGSVLHSGSFMQSQSGIARGQRSVQTFVYTEGGATISLYSLIYRVYKPN